MARRKKTEPEMLKQEARKEPEPAEQEVTQEPEPEEQETTQEPEPEEQEAAQEPETEGQAIPQERDMFAKIPNPCVYCGPSVRGVARQYTTYHGGISDALRDFIKAYPEALGLIVPTGNFPAMRKRLETPGTPEAVIYKLVKARLPK